MTNQLMKSNGTPAATADGGPARGAVATPPVDILETEHEFVLLADLPGVAPGEVDIRFERGELTLHGRRSAAPSDREAVAREQAGANFVRTFAVSEAVAADKIEAELKDGVLRLTLPKHEAVKPRRIAVKG